MIDSNAKQNKNDNQNNKENISDDYKIFSNLLKDKGGNIKMVTSNIFKQNQASKLYYYNNEYFENPKTQNIKVERLPSKQKI